MTGVEIDMVVTDSLKALELYEKIFEVKRIEVTRFHMLDENPEYQLIAPKPGQPQSVWYNVLVPDIQAVYHKAMAAGCAEIQPVTEMPEMGAANAMFADAFGYVWMLHQIHREVSFEERCKAMEEKQK